ncbi:MAG: HlyC/CorC family transporter [Planctomycetes bacterium]|nr:HlyC/CorC family transporter [Planctomycetota bacterium]
MDGGTLVVLIIAAFTTLLFSVVHYTLINPSRVRLEHAFSDRRRSRCLAQLDRHMDQMLLVTAVVRVVCHLLIFLSLIRVVGQAWRWDTGLAVMALAAAIVVVFGIGIPHAWAKYAGERTVAMMWPLLQVTRCGLWPIGKDLAAVDLAVRRLSGHREQSDGRTTEVEQEILQLASEGQAEGELDAGEMEMITSVIEFHDIRASEIMTPRTDIEALPVEAARDRCVAAVLGVGHSRIPVYEQSLDSVIGVLYAKDLLAVTDQEEFDLRKIMRKPYFVPETKAISDLLKEFKAQKVHMAIVLDEYGGTAGLVTIEDLLEELVGEIADEYEKTEPALLRRVDDRTVEVDARMYIDDLNDELGIELPEEEDYDTVGGFVFSTLGYIPKANEQFDHEGINFTILEAEQRKINRIRVQLPEQAKADKEQ